MLRIFFAQHFLGKNSSKMFAFGHKYCIVILACRYKGEGYERSKTAGGAAV